MPRFRRIYVPDALYFVTTVTRDRKPVFRNGECMEALYDTLRQVRRLHPFVMIAHVALWDHLHLLVRPVDDTNISQVLHSLKLGTTGKVKSLLAAQPMRLWQSRFWDRIIGDEKDLNRHIDYIHYNPVKHGYVTRPEDWPRSSYREWLRRGYYDEGWGHAEPTSVVGWERE